MAVQAAVCHWYADTVREDSKAEKSGAAGCTDLRG